MDLTLLGGIIVVIAAYTIIWLFIIKSKNIIKQIKKNGSKNTRKIKKDLNL